MKNLNVGLIGYKFMGKAHTNAFKQANMFFDGKALFNLKAICGREEEKVKAAKIKFSYETYETDWNVLCERDDIDLIDITAPSNFHKEIALKALDSGKHVFCEKPLALNLADAKQMYEAAVKSGLKHQVGFNYRFVPAIMLAKKLIDEGKLGDIYHFRGLYLQDWIIDPDFPLVWRLDKNVAGSGSLGDIGAHIIDLARYLVGDINRVVGMEKTFIKERPIVKEMTGLTADAGDSGERGPVTVDDATLFLLEFNNGAIGSMEATRFATGHKNGMGFEINGSRGSVRFEFERMNELYYYSEEDEEYAKGFRKIQVTEGIHPYTGNWWPVGHVIGYGNTFVHEFYEFGRSITEDIPCTPDFKDGMECNRVMEAVQLSIEEGCWIEISRI